VDGVFLKTLIGHTCITLESQMLL